MTRVARDDDLDREELSLRHEHCPSPDAYGGDTSRALVGFDLEDARSSHLEALFDHPPQRAVARRASGEIPGEASARRSRRRVLDDGYRGTIHARAHVG